ncbi:MAG: nucleotide exchange factor GrpE [Pseudomonadota bacterium]
MNDRILGTRTREARPSATGMGDKGMGDKDYEENEGQEAGGEMDDDAASIGEDIAAGVGPDDLGLDPDMLANAAVAGLQDEVDRLNDKLLRSAAELENTRRRAERERQDAGKYAIANFARDLLSVADNFERALAAAPEDPSELSADGLKGLMTGVRMTEKELLTMLERHGVKRISPTGEKFDPNLHQAVAQAPAAGVPSGHVANVAQTGFVLGDRVLRAAMVVVSTGEPPQEADAAGGDNPGSDQSSNDDEASSTRVNTRV